MNKMYEQGFIDKCAQYGVDPDKLVKQAGIGNVLSRLGSRFLASKWALPVAAAPVVGIGGMVTLNKLMGRKPYEGVALTKPFGSTNETSPINEAMYRTFGFGRKPLFSFGGKPSEQK